MISREPRREGIDAPLSGFWNRGRVKSLLICLMVFSLGVLSGGFLFSKTQPRSFLAVTHCQSCMKPKDLAGLMTSVGIQRFPGFIPYVALETDKTIAIKLPLRGGKDIHYVVVPKKDIKNIGEFSEEDVGYVTDSLLVIRTLINRDHMRKYRVLTNGPGFQDVTYLHFHLVGR